jgi:hypothetical protein
VTDSALTRASDGGSGGALRPSRRGLIFHSRSGAPSLPAAWRSLLRACSARSPAGVAPSTPPGFPLLGVECCVDATFALGGKTGVDVRFALFTCERGKGAACFAFETHEGSAAAPCGFLKPSDQRVRIVRKAAVIFLSLTSRPEIDMSLSVKKEIARARCPFPENKWRACHLFFPARQGKGNPSGALVS